ncbi:TIGR02996 domain-containing protein [Frigoriglobus tundricola]|uniref:TIGR02996 domain-containing protein n=1 Tax=Frigoriglobus tundricola TaxID=2774151 RepID=A0A6M5YLM3_9BACT|nr:TIGR02996 domain-containing protein [Frigoriglobus tundricola]QJW94216.1 hypothetical protein FTUN_1736 [Frigoriglobus tundricola]
MNERKGFLKLLAENEDDLTTRLVYADWLDERGEHEEADRQRKWPAAKEWLVRFCRQNNPADEQDTEEWFISYETLLELGREAVERDGRELWFSCGNNMGMCDALRSECGPFWKNWSIVTGVPVPPDAEARSSFSCAC